MADTDVLVQVTSFHHVKEADSAPQFHPDWPILLMNHMYPAVFRQEHTVMYIYIYIYIERERERERYLHIHTIAPIL